MNHFFKIYWQTVHLINVDRPQTQFDTNNDKTLKEKKKKMNIITAKKRLFRKDRNESFLFFLNICSCNIYLFFVVKNNSECKRKKKERDSSKLKTKKRKIVVFFLKLLLYD
jgi:hypothetical protein